jgi:hypothetical protein
MNPALAKLFVVAQDVISSPTGENLESLRVALKEAKGATEAQIEITTPEAALRVVQSSLNGAFVYDPNVPHPEFRDRDAEIAREHELDGIYAQPSSVEEARRVWKFIG